MIFHGEDNVVEIIVMNTVGSTDKNSICKTRLQHMYASGVKQSTSHCAFVILFDKFVNENKNILFHSTLKR